MKEALSQNEIRFVNIDITSGMLPLKQFLKYRDNRPEFDEIKAKNRERIVRGINAVKIGRASCRERV